MAENVEKAVKLPPSAQIATADNDITIPNYSDVLRPTDDTLIQKGGGEGLKLYDQLERDNHCHSVLQKRRLQLVAREWVVKAGGEDAVSVAAADHLREVLDDLPFDQICLDLLDATLKGFAVGEIDWLPDGGHLQIAGIRSIDQRRIVFDRDWRPRLLTMSAPSDGEELPDRKFLVHRVGVKGNNPYGLGAGTRLFWAVLFKREGVAFWRRHLERFSSPIPVGKFPLGTSLAEQRALELTLQMMNHASSITVPIGTELDTFEAKRSGTVDHETWAKFWNAEMSKAVLGETLTTEMGDNGARAASETHADMLAQLVDGDADILSTTLNGQLVKWFVELNHAGAALPQIWRVRPANELAEETLKTKRANRRVKDMEALERGRELGFEPENVEAYMEEVFGGPVRAVVPAQKKTSPNPLNLPLPPMN